MYGSRNQKELVVKQVNQPGDVAWQGRLIEGSSSNNFEIEEVDTDGDRLSDILEAQIGTDPNLWDTDADNLSDGFEVSFDGISDQYLPGQDLNPFIQDTDNKRFNDDIEINYSSNPLLQTETPANGDTNEHGSVNSSDILMITRIAPGIDTPTQQQMLRGDVAPRINGLSAPGNINAGDMLLIARKALGIVQF